MTALRTLYPPIEPYETGTLDVGDGHVLYYERSGTRGAKPAIFLHGGPGGGISAKHRQLFDPKLYDVLLFDQRGCGRSTPYAELEHNTTWHLVADIGKLHQLMGTEQWLVFGGSWGSSLALAYAETYPEHVSELVLRGVFTLRQAELDWYYQYGASEIFPDHWADFLAPIPSTERHDPLMAYRKLLTGNDEAARLQAAAAWTLWEGRTLNLMPESLTGTGFVDQHFALAFARIENHYFIHQGWLEEGQLIDNAGRLKGIRGTIVQGRYDMVCPARTAYDLHQAWPDADFALVEGAGHSYLEPATLDRLIRATEHYALAPTLPRLDPCSSDIPSAATR
ncbi:prolyl aminopeptidase [Aquisediminimonas sediminicola]|uniref:prolyl aminopeptidase n=1 Tax=Alteraquisediminimonas sediminicola TaxID=2676787 RepID=UPI001C8E9C2C|nr:prolyl aminopeptidase [Aquisediminimonas sediminicola]